MSEAEPSGYGDSPDTTDGGVGQNMVDGTPGNDPADGGERDTTLTTDDAAQRADSPERPGNDPD
jgi:hypothetical protein